MPPDGTLERSPEKEEILGLIMITIIMRKRMTLQTPVVMMRSSGLNMMMIIRVSYISPAARRHLLDNYTVVDTVCIRQYLFYVDDDLSPVKEDNRGLSVQRFPRLPFRSSL